jgi:predicted aspartyl protease
VPASILFDSGASHSFIYACYVHANSLPYLAMRRPMIVITLKGPYEATYMSHKIEVTILGRKFWAMPIVLEERTIDLILGMNWLKQWKAVIHCARGTIELSSPDGDRFEVIVAPPTSTKPAIYMVNDKFVGEHIKIDREFLDVFPEELPKMPPALLEICLFKTHFKTDTCAFYRSVFYHMVMNMVRHFVGHLSLIKKCFETVT